MSVRQRTSAEGGQAIVLVVAVLAVLIGIAALVIDGGSWLRAQRHLQTAADAAALAGAQNLPTDQSGASSVAISYAQQNYPGIPAPTVTFPDAGTINVAAQTTAPGFLAKIYGAAFSNVNITAHARAQVSVPAFLKNVAPVAVKNTVACAATNPGCYGQTLTLVFNESQVSSSTIGLIDLTCHSTQSNACASTAGIGGSELENWIENGYPDALPANQWYGVKTGETVGPVKHGFEQRVGVPLFFPVFDQVTNTGSQYFFHVIGWAAFVINPGGITWGPQGRQLVGHFTTFIATDLAAGGPIGGSTDFGVHTITLIQ
ncbi:MAG TPA: pilus assembly protein TadG-related protein [Gaiellaceae bacterium]|nr:pilus assembly protein TadG-related protein [Gaiellaceae bacterium]